MLRNSCERITFACGSRASRISACDRYIRMRDLECCGICASVSPSHAELVRYALRASLRMRNRPIRMRKRHSQETRMRISCGRMKIFFRVEPRSVSLGINKIILSTAWPAQSPTLNSVVRPIVYGLFACLSVFLSVCLSVCLSVRIL